MVRCSFPGCDKKSLGQNLCTGHYQQKRNGKELTPLKKPEQDNYPVVNGKKQCRECKEVKSVSDFYQVKGASPKLDCKSCYTIKVLKRRA